MHEASDPGAARRLSPRLVLLQLALLVLMVCPVVAGEPIPHGQGLLWRIEAPGGAVSHLFGTMHAADPRVVELPAAVAETLATAQSVTVEVIMSPAARQRLGAAMVLRAGRTLADMVEPALLQRVLEVGDRYGMPGWQLKAIAPWALATLFSTPPVELRRREGGAPVLDELLQSSALRRGLPLYGLESVDEQIAVFAGLPEADQLALLEIAVAENARIAWWWEQLVAAYLGRDLAGYIELMHAQTAPDQQGLAERFLERLIDARNGPMVERMTPRLTEGGAFIAVGALHLPGERGILQLLAQRGYEIARVY